MWWMNGMITENWLLWLARPYAHDIRVRNGHQILVPESGIGFWYQWQLEAKFLVPETNMADDRDEIGAVCVIAETVVKQRENRKWLQCFLFLPRLLIASTQFSAPSAPFSSPLTVIWSDRISWVATQQSHDTQSSAYRLAARFSLHEFLVSNRPYSILCKKLSVTWLNSHTLIGYLGLFMFFFIRFLIAVNTGSCYCNLVNLFIYLS